MLLLVFATAIWAFASRLDPEAEFLGACSWLGLTGIALLDRARAHLTAIASIALLLAVVALPAGVGRASAVSLTLLLVSAATLSRRWKKQEELSLLAAAGLGLVASVLLRPEWLLPGALGPMDLLRLLVGPALVAGAYRWTRRFWSAEAALTCLVVVLVGARGATLTAALALVAPWLLELTTATGPGARRWALPAVGVAALFRRPRVVLAALIATSLRRAPGAVVLLAGVVAGAAAWWSTSGEGTSIWLGVLAMAPALVWPGLRRPMEAAGLLLFGWAGACWAGIGGAVVAASFGLARLDEAGRLPRAALGWAAVLASGAGLTGAYPWMRTELDWLFGSPVWTAVAAILLFAAGSLASRWGARAWVVAGVTAWLLFLIGLDSPGRDLRRDEGPLLLTADARFWGVDWSEASVCSLSIESALGNAEELPQGLEVGWVGILTHQAGERRFPLVVGDHTGEWAARGVPGASVPEPWVHWVARADLMGQRYRASWRVEPEAVSVRRIRVVRGVDLPEEVELMVWSFQARPC